MIRTLKIQSVVAFCGAALSLTGYGQTRPATLIQVDVENNAFYNYDTFDNTKLAGNPAATTPVAARNFQMVLGLGDIVAINGKPAKGTQVIRLSVLNLSPSATPGQAISDSTWANVNDQVLDVLQPDGTRVGTILASGFGGGPAPPGAPLSAVLGSNLAITGGTGAFLGARGQIEVKSAVQGRAASISEDPAYRRNRTGGSRTFIVHLIPMSQPEIVLLPSGPAVVHSANYSLVDATRPAKAGELLTLYATGLGPTRPGVDPGSPFASDPVQYANSPIEVSVNGTPAEVLYSGGYTGTTDGFQINFRVPAGVPSGIATLQLSAAWVSGAAVKIPIQ
jgi:uncharacterized protein (TIGR03437 family)